MSQQFPFVFIFMLLIIDIMVASIDDLEMLFCRCYSYHNLDVMSKIHKKNMINIMKWRTRTRLLIHHLSSTKIPLLLSAFLIIVITMTPSAPQLW